MRFKKYLKERRSSMTKHFKVPKGMTVKKVHSDKKGDVWLNKKHKAGNIFGKSKYKISSWFQNNEVVIAKLKKINEYSGGSPVSQLMYGAYGAETRRAPKTGVSRDYLGGKGGKNISGTAAPIEVYYDPLDPRNRKKRKKRNFLTMHNRMM